MREGVGSTVSGRAYGGRPAWDGPTGVRYGGGARQAGASGVGGVETTSSSSQGEVRWGRVNLGLRPSAAGRRRDALCRGVEVERCHGGRRRCVEASRSKRLGFVRLCLCCLVGLEIEWEEEWKASKREEGLGLDNGVAIFVFILFFTEAGTNAVISDTNAIMNSCSHYSSS